MILSTSKQTGSCALLALSQPPVETQPCRGDTFHSSQKKIKDVKREVRLLFPAPLPNFWYTKEQMGTLPIREGYGESWQIIIRRT